MFNRLKKSLITVFGISSVEANGIVLLFLILAAIIFSSVVWVRLKHDEYQSYHEDKRLLDSLLTLMSVDSVQASIVSDIPSARSKRVFFKFDPNTASREDLNRLGFPEWISSRIVKYRNSGGKFKIRNDLNRIYGMPADFFLEIKPYIQLPDSLPRDIKSVDKKPRKSVPTANLNPIDLNDADSLQLTRIKGIGPVLASRIVKYRDLLGGYISIEQLDEVYGLKDPALSRIKKRAYIDKSYSPRKIMINFAEWKDFVHHPYIDKYLANAIVTTRDKSGPFHTTDDLRKIKSMNDSTISKISPYITF